MKTAKAKKVTIDFVEEVFRKEKIDLSITKIEKKTQALLPVLKDLEHVRSSRRGMQNESIDFR